MPVGGAFTTYISDSWQQFPVHCQMSFTFRELNTVIHSFAAVMRGHEQEADFSLSFTPFRLSDPGQDSNASVTLLQFLFKGILALFHDAPPA